MGPDLHTDAVRKEFAAQLERLDFFRYTPPHLLPRLRARLQRTGSILNTQTRRVYFADEERLAECGVHAFLREVRFVLTAQGVLLQMIEEDCDHDGYAITLNKRRYTLYSSAEIEADRVSQGRDINIWDLTGRRTCALINLLLMEHHSSERLYSFAGGNDHLAIFLTEALYTLVRMVDIDQIGNLLVLYQPDELPEIRAQRGQ